MNCLLSMKHKIGKNHFKTQRYSVYYHDKIVSVCIVCKYRFRLNTLSPTPLVLLYFCLSLPRGQSGAYRSNVDPFITILLSGRSNEWGVEKMGFGWYHWVSRWVAMSGRLNGGLQGCQSGKGFSRWPPLTPAHWQKETDWLKFQSWKWPWMSSEQQGMRLLGPGGVWAEMRYNSREHWGNLSLTPGCYMQYQEIRPDM